MNQKIGIVGPGAIGLFLAHHLNRANRNVTVLARPSAVVQLAHFGIELITADGRHSRERVNVAPVSEAKGFDLLILALKGHQLTASARELRPVLENSRTVMTAMNGVPWWFAHGNEFGSVPLRAVDEHGLLSAIVDLKKIVGAVVNIAARVERLGVVHHIAGCSLSVGPAIPSAIDRASMVQQCFAETGITIDCPSSDNLRLIRRFEKGGSGSSGVRV